MRSPNKDTAGYAAKQTGPPEGFEVARPEEWPPPALQAGVGKTRIDITVVCPFFKIRTTVDRILTNTTLLLGYERPEADAIVREMANQLPAGEVVILFNGHNNAEVCQVEATPGKPRLPGETQQQYDDDLLNGTETGRRMMKRLDDQIETEETETEENTMWTLVIPLTDDELGKHIDGARTSSYSGTANCLRRAEE